MLQITDVLIIGVLPYHQYDKNILLLHNPNQLAKSIINLLIFRGSKVRQLTVFGKVH